MFGKFFLFYVYSTEEAKDMLVVYSLLCCSRAACTKPAVAVQTLLVHVLLDCMSCIATFCTLFLCSFSCHYLLSLFKEGAEMCC